MSVNQYQSSTKENALGESLGILKSSGDKVFRKIHRMQMPKSSNAISSSLDISRFSKRQLSDQVSKASHKIRSTFKSLKFSGERILENMPKINSSNNAMGESYKSLKVSGQKIIDKISRPSKANIT